MLEQRFLIGAGEGVHRLAVFEGIKSLGPVTGAHNAIVLKGH